MGQDIKEMGAKELKAYIAELGEKGVDISGAKYNSKAVMIAFIESLVEEGEDLKNQAGETITGQDEVPSDKPEEAEKGEEAEVAEEAEEDEDEEKFYKGKLVLRSLTKIQNGRTYKEVHTTDASYLLSKEEFAAEVTTKK